jgi:hypothetical protein
LKRALLLLLASACAPGPVASPASGGSNVEASRVSGPSGESLVAACTPTGPELCFNAIDDNCNGVLDEGCGVSTGVLQFVVAWGESPADLDLSVTMPSGERVHDGNRSTPSGLRLERDCPGEGCQGQNFENVYFEGLEPPPGRYSAEIRLGDARGSALPVRARFGARIGARSYGADISFTETDERKVFTFDL